MFERSQKGMTLKRRPVQDTVSPIEQSDLENLRRYSSGERDNMLSLTSPSSRESTDTALPLPHGFGLDKFGLMVHEKYAVPALSNTTESDTSMVHVPSVTETNPETHLATAGSAQPAALEETEPAGVLDEHLVNETLDHFLATQSDDGMSTSSVQSNVAFSGAAQNTTGSAARILRERLQKPSYRDAQVAGGYRSKSKQTKTIVPKAPSPCCPAEVPSALLASLDDPSSFTEAAKEFSPYIEKLCLSHLQKYAQRTSAMAFAQQRHGLVGNGNGTIISPAMITDAIPPRRRRTASLSDIDWRASSPKRQRLPELHSYPDVWVKRPSFAGESQMQDPVTDETYRKQVILQLEEKLKPFATFDTHGLQTNKLIFNLLQRAKPPNTDEKRGPVEALCLTIAFTSLILVSLPSASSSVTWRYSLPSASFSRSMNVSIPMASSSIVA
jgi:hypothetical protein